MRVALVALLLLVPSAARSVEVCYDESRYPSVIRLDVTETGLRVFPDIEVDRSQPQTKGSVIIYSEPRGWEATDFACEGGSGCIRTKRSVILYSESRGWEASEFACRDGSDCYGSSGHREFPGPAVTLSTAEAIKLRPELAHVWSGPDEDSPPAEIEQNIRAWTEHDGAIWFGIQFYDGEGVSGVGGVGRFDPKTGQDVVRRPPRLLDLSVFQIVHDGRWLWLAVGGSYECSGVPPSLGLVRYDWNADRLETLNEDDGPCGFTVHDLLLDPKYLWVATDLGLSRRDRTTGKWEHFVPVPGATPPMQPTTCEALYTRLLETLPRKEINTDSLYTQFLRSLQGFHPRFFAGYKDTTPPEKWGCDELFNLSSRRRDYPAFKELVLDVVPATNPNLQCALNAFAENGSREPEWRDFLLARLEASKTEAGNQQQADTLGLLEHFAPDSKVAEVLARRLTTAEDPRHEAEMLPSFMGNKSVPLLMAALDRFQKEGGSEVESIIIGLMRATKSVIWPDGRLTNPWPVSYDRMQACATFRCYFGNDYVPLGAVADQWQAWWGAHKQEYETGQEPDGHGAPPSLTN